MQPATSACLKTLKKKIDTKLSKMNLFNIDPNTTYALSEFVSQQERCRAAISEELQTFTHEVRTLVRRACDLAMRDFLTEHGFTGAVSGGTSPAIAPYSVSADLTLYGTGTAVPGVVPGAAGAAHQATATARRQASAAATAAVRAGKRVPVLDVESATGGVDVAGLSGQHHITYSEQAAIRRMSRHLLRFVRTCDFLMLDALQSLGVRSAGALRDVMLPERYTAEYRLKALTTARGYSASADEVADVHALFMVEVHADLGMGEFAHDEDAQAKPPHRRDFMSETPEQMRRRDRRRQGKLERQPWLREYDAEASDDEEEAAALLAAGYTLPSTLTVTPPEEEGAAAATAKAGQRSPRASSPRPRPGAATSPRAKDTKPQFTPGEVPDFLTKHLPVRRRNLPGGPGTSSTTGLLFHPRTASFKQSVEGVIAAAVKAISASSTRLVYHEVFEPLHTVTRDESPEGGEGVGLPRPGSLDVESLILRTPEFQRVSDDILESLEAAFEQARDACRVLQPFRLTARSNLRILQHLMRHTVDGLTPHTLQRMLAKHARQEARLALMPADKFVGLLRLDSSGLKAALQPTPQQCCSTLLELLPPIAQDRNEVLLAQLSVSEAKMGRGVKDVSQYVALMEAWGEATDRLDVWREREAYVAELFILLQKEDPSGQLLSDQATMELKVMQEKYSRLRTRMHEVEGSAEANNGLYARELDLKVPKLRSMVNETRTTADAPIVYDAEADPAEAVAFLTDLAANVAAMQQQAAEYQRYQRTLKLSVTPFESLDHLERDVGTKLKLWQGVADWNAKREELLDSVVWALDPADFGEVVTSFVRTAIAVERAAADALADTGVLEAFKASVNHFRLLIPVVADLRCEALEERHWAQLTTTFGQDLQAATALTLRELVDMGVVSKAGELSRVASEATQERILLQMLRTLEARWEDVTFTTQPFKYAPRSAFILTGWDDIQTNLDESFVMLHTIMSSRYVKPIKTQVQPLYDALAELQTVIEVWAACQKSWMTLFPIFMAQDIQRNLNTEYTTFKKVDGDFRELTRKVNQTPNARRMCEKTPGLAKDLARYIERLEFVQRGLDSYMESKRRAFPRFYFLSDGDLLHILAAASTNPRAVVQHLLKLFDNIAKLHFHEALGAGYDVLAMESSEGEVVPLGPNLKARDAPEVWLEALEGAMRAAVRKAFSDALVAYPTLSDLTSAHELLSNLEMGTLQRKLRGKDEGRRRRRGRRGRRGRATEAAVEEEASWEVKLARDFSAARAEWAVQGAGGAESLPLPAQAVCAAAQIRFTQGTEAAIQAAAELTAGQDLPVGLAATVLESNKAAQLAGVGGIPSNMDLLPEVSAVLGLATDEASVAEADAEASMRIIPTDPRLALAAWYCTQVRGLEGLTALVRGPLTKLQRKIVVSLLTTEVHNRDIVMQLVKEDVRAISSFSWKQQLRFYWGKTDASATHSTCIVRQSDTDLDYQFEYEGATSRLVITPLTDRCWMTITGAFRLALGANPQGPAGTGKTESSKDLAKALGIQCIVLNCSEQITYANMAKLFSGLAQSAAWSVLDEFNRIDIEVLSVIAQLLLELRTARLSGAATLSFNGGEPMTLRPHMIIPTMNPGYAGRTELPDNLKVFFRPVAMMVPDYALIAEIILFAEGFDAAPNLSRKMVKLYKLSSEQLSQQRHYDFGMRAVKSVLVMAGALKRGNPELPEDVVLIRAMRDSNVPKFLAADLPLFHAIVGDLFPGVEVPDAQEEALKEAIQYQLVEDGRQPRERFVRKVVQLRETLKVRFGVALVGPPSGKTTAYSTLAKAITRVNAAEANWPAMRGPPPTSLVKPPRGQTGEVDALTGEGSGPRWDEWSIVKVKQLNPKSISMGELYGKYDELTQDWSDGLAASIMRAVVSSESQAEHWTVFDGPIDALWIENMNTVLDDNMMLYLANGERVKLKPSMRMLFEVQDLQQASPATVSRLGVVYMTPEDLGWQPVVQSWLSTLLMQTLVPTPPMRHKLWANFKGVVGAALNHMQDGVDHQPVSVSHLSLVTSLCSLVEIMLTALRRAGVPIPDDEQPAVKLVDRVFLWAFVWSFGATATADTWRGFDVFTRGVMKKAGVDLSGLPGTGTVFDCYISTQPPALAQGGVEHGGTFRMWRELVPHFNFEPGLPFHSIIVPTVDTTRYAHVLNYLLLSPRINMDEAESLRQLLPVIARYQAEHHHWKAETARLEEERAAAAELAGLPPAGSAPAARGRRATRPNMKVSVSKASLSSKGAQPDAPRQAVHVDSGRKVVHPWLLPWEEQALRLLTKGAFDPADPSSADQDVPFLPGVVGDWAFDFSWMGINAGGGPLGVAVAPLTMRPVFLTGSTGTGKSVLLSSLLREAAGQDVKVGDDEESSAVAVAVPQAPATGGASAAAAPSEGKGDDAASVRSWDSQSTVSEASVEGKEEDEAAAAAAAEARAAAAAAEAQSKASALAKAHQGSLLGESAGRHTVPITAIPLTFSAQTSSGGVQAQVQGKLERKRKGRFGAPEGRRAVVFVDDVNMPKPEEYGAQPPIELLRQLADYGGWYDRTSLHWNHLQDTALVVAGAPPGGGRRELSERFMRHCSVLCLPTAGPDVMSAMFSAIVGGFLGTKFSAEVRAAAGSIVSSTIHVYFRCSSELKPTPSKSHYVFNLRDVSRVVQGLLMTSPQQCRSASDVARLWVHEACRVFADRLTTEDDLEWLQGVVVSQLNKSFRLPWTVEGLFGEEATLGAATGRAARAAERAESLEGVGGEAPTSVGGVGPLLFGDWLHPGSDVPAYEDCKNPHKLPALMDGYMEEYNLSSPAPLHLVFFEDAISHVARICRVLAMPRGSALLVGVSGSGKASLTRLAAFISGCDCVSPDMSGSAGQESFREDLKDLLLSAGVEGTPSVLLMGDAQIVNEAILEDLNCLLNSGEIPGLFAQEDQDAIVSRLAEKLDKGAPAPSPDGNMPAGAGGGDPEASGPALPSSPADIERAFIARVRANLHVVLSMSPVGAQLRTRLRQFPSLLNCCTIDWFMPWPRAALISVGERLLAPLTLPSPAEIGGRVGQDGDHAVHMPAPAHPLWHHVVLACVDLHSAVDTFIPQFAAATKRQVYNTPRSYLDLLAAYNRLLGKKYAEERGTLDRLQNGIRTLDNTVEAVTTLQARLGEMQPVLKQRAEETAALVTKVQAEQKVVAGEREKVDAEADIVLSQQQQVEALQAEAQAELDIAMPAMLAAQEAVKQVDPAKLTILRSFNNPPAQIVTLMEAVCVLFEEKPGWDNGKRLMQGVAAGNVHGNFLKDLELYDTRRVTSKMLRKVATYTRLPAMQPSAMETVSSAALSICNWVHAVEKFVLVQQEVAPKERRVAEMNAQLAIANEALQEKQSQLAGVVARVEALQALCAEKQAEKARLESEEARARAQLQRAEKLLSGMASAGARWRVSVKERASTLGQVVGDVLLAAAHVVYSGPFTGEFRGGMQAAWAAAVDSHKLPRSATFSLPDVLATPVEVNNWMISGLPKDDTSIANGLLVTRAQRWPLMIDPQGQGKNWVRTMAGEALEVVDMVSGHAEAKAGVGEAAEPESPRAGGTASSAMLKAHAGRPMNLAQTLEKCVRLGLPLLLEECGTKLPPVMAHVLAQTVVRDGAEASIRVGDRLIPYDGNFRLYMCTSEPNPHFLPDTSIRVSLVNFTVTSRGLEEQLLSQAVAKERPDLESTSSQLLMDIAGDRKQLQALEDSVLAQIAEAGEDILDNTALIANLSAAQTKASRVEQRVQATEATAAIVSAARDTYRLLAQRGSLLYSVVTMLASVDPMYQYSLQYFTRLFDLCLTDPSVHGAEAVAAAAAARDAASRGKGAGRPASAASAASGASKRKGAKPASSRKVAASGASTGGHSDASSEAGASAAINVAALTQGIPGLSADGLERRVAEQVDRLSAIVYDNIQRGLFEKDKLLLSLLLACRLLQTSGQVSRREVGLLLRGAGVMNRDEQPLNPSLRYDPDDFLGGEGAMPLTEDEVAALRNPLPPAGWDLICKLTEEVPEFAFLQNHVRDNYHEWALWRLSPAPHEAKLPDDIEGHLSTLQKLLLVKAFAPDKLVFGLGGLVRDTLGEAYLTPAGVSLAQVFTETSPVTPCVFVLSQGADPTQRLLEFAARKGMSARLQVIALGQGQGERAARLIERAAVEGDWVLLQNCHLAKSWLPDLARLLDRHRKAPDALNAEFRLWLTSFPAPYFPASILQHGIKITNEPPKGIRANMQRSFGVLIKPHRLAAFDLPPPRSPRGSRARMPPGSGSRRSLTGDSDASDAGSSEGKEDGKHLRRAGSSKASLKGSKADLSMGLADDGGPTNFMGLAWRRLCVGLSFFHALVQERRKFGALGWNIRYEFSDSDLDTSLQTLQNLLQGAALAAGETASLDALPEYDSEEEGQEGAGDGEPPTPSARADRKFIGSSAVAASPQELYRALQASSEDGTPLPWDALTYVVGHINYGGRVTDDWDRRTLLALLKAVLTPKAVTSTEFLLSDSGKYFIPKDVTASGIAEYLSTLPARDETEVFGMHPNADAAFRLSESDYLLRTALDTGLASQKSGGAAPPSPARRKGRAPGTSTAPTPLGAAAGESKDSTGSLPPASADAADTEVLRLLNDLGSRVPAPLDVAAVARKVRESTVAAPRAGRSRHRAHHSRRASSAASSGPVRSRRMSAVLLKPAQMAAVREGSASRSGAASRVGSQEGRYSSMGASSAASGASAAATATDMAGPAEADALPPNSLLVVLQQEATKFNLLLSTMRESMMALRKVLLGEAAMSDALEAMYAALVHGRVPAVWADVAYPSMRPLASWIADLNRRVQFMDRWIGMGDMREYWLPAFFFPQGFLTAVLQRHARKYQVAINDLEFEFAFYTAAGVVHAGERPGDPRPRAPADDGVMVNGLWLESGQWNDEVQGLADPVPGEVYSALPRMRMLPALKHTTAPGAFVCPVYKTLARAGTLSTTGISTNYVVSVELPSQMPSEHWIWRGTALVLDVMNED